MRIRDLKNLIQVNAINNGDGYPKSVAMGCTGCPSLDCDNKIPRVDQAEFPGLHHSPPDSCIDVFLPEVRISRSRLFVEKGVDATVEMASATGSDITSDG